MARCNGDYLNCIYDDCIATDADCVNFEKQEKISITHKNKKNINDIIGNSTKRRNVEIWIMTLWKE